MEDLMSVGVVGAGVMGIGIVQVAALAGHPVKLLDAREGAAAAAIVRLGDTLATLVSKGRLAADARDAALARIEAVSEVAQLAGCGLAIEAIVEQVEPKRTLLRQLEAVLAPQALLASNTSSLSITLLANGLSRPERLVGMHFFNPVPLMRLVEVVSGAETDPAAAAQVEALARAWGKQPVHAASTPGFIVNRIARPFYAETLALLQERAAAPEVLDACLRAAGFRMGPCELMDLIGHDTNALVTRAVWEANFGDRRYQPSLIQQALVDGGRLGRKSGRGFFVGPAPRWPVVQRPAAALPITLVGRGPNVEMLVRRLPGVARESTEAGWSGLRSGSLELAFTDGRCAYEAGRPLMDWLAHEQADALGVTTDDAQVADLLACAGLRAMVLRDTPGLVVARTLAMLVNEASDAVWQGVCTEEGADTAMRLGVNYPDGPFAWRRLFGAEALCSLLDHIWTQTRSERYRISPPLRAASTSATPCKP
ncbi:MAG: 3-hydroxyacyl-CoA dehydrogenase [Burkholderiales bacterium]|nr:3-hydroxyacyl-CoA dehydrogenase [Burkholderiales bacterium]